MRIHLLSLSMVVACSPAAAAPAEWQPCPENAAVSCTTLDVPVDWDSAGDDRFGMAVARHPATGEKHGTVVYLPAGPGSSGVDAVTNEQILDLLVPKEVVEHFDVVSFDPRGVRRSSPVTCDAGLVATLDRPEPRDQAEFDALLDAQAAVGADCRERTGPVFDHLDSTQVARDVDALRAALGEDELNVYALSYGTVVGQMYAERFPERIRTMVLDAVFDHTVDPGALTSRIVQPLTQPDLPAVAEVITNLESAQAARDSAETTPLPIFLQCADNRNDVRSYADLARLAARTRAVAPDLRTSAFDLASLCVNPPVPATNPQRPLHAPDAPPVLVTNARADAATPYEGARHVAAQLPGAVLLTWDGMGHGAATRTACTRDHVLRYFTDTTLPAPGTHCPA